MGRAPHRRWLFPGGELASDPELAGRLANAVAGLVLDAAAHREEHAIEVQLPLLARFAPQVRVVGIAVGDGSLPELLRFGGELAGVLADMPERPLLVISSDMNHFADDDGDAAGGSPGAGRHRHARPRSRVRDRAAEPH